MHAMTDTAFTPPITTIDVRTVVPRARHTVIFAKFQSLGVGDALELVNDHDLRTLSTTSCNPRHATPLIGTTSKAARTPGACRSPSGRLRTVRTANAAAPATALSDPVRLRVPGDASRAGHAGPIRSTLQP
jgi:hypothetical protein